MNMQKRIWIVVAFLVSWSVRADEVNISAAASLKECLNEIIEAYGKKMPNTRIVPNYEASGKLQKQIENGAPVDLFISANQDKMDAVEKKALIKKGSRINLLGNKVVLIVPVAKPRVIDSFAALGSDKLKASGLAIGDPKVVPAGAYALDVLAFFKITDQVLPKVVYAQNVRAVLAYVAQGEVDAGIVYLTDALAMKERVKIIATAPEGSHQPTIYPAAVVTTGANAAGGEAFLSFLKGDEAAQIFITYGFTKAR
jgi:molybdate transport system substrate-binding protein